MNCIDVAIILGISIILYFATYVNRFCKKTNTIINKTTSDIEIAENKCDEIAEELQQCSELLSELKELSVEYDAYMEELYNNKGEEL